MKVRKMLLREEAEKVLHTKSNGDKLVANSSGYGYSAYTKDNVHIGHIEAETDAAAVAEFSKKEPKYESMNEDYLSSPEYRIQRYEDDIPDLFHRVHDGYMNGMVNAKAYADVLAKIYSILEELDYMDESLKESYMDTHEGVAHVDTLDLMAALKSVVKDYGHMELVTPLYCELHDDDHGRRLELNRAVEEGLIPDKIVPDKIGGDINLNLDGSHSSVGFLGGTANNTNNGEEGDHDASNVHNEVLDEATLTEKGPKVNKKAAAKALADKVDDAATAEEKAKMMKKIIERVPTDKVASLTDDIKSMIPDRGLTEEDKEILKKKTNIDPKFIEGADSVMTLIDNVLDGVQMGLPVLGAIIDILHFAIPDELATAACPPLAAVLAILSYIPDGFVISILLDFGITALRGIGTLAKNATMAGVKVLPDKEEANEDIDDDFMDAENMDMSEFDSHVGKEEDIEFVMSEYIPDSLLIEFVKKVEKNKYLVGVEDEVVTVEFDPNWSEYVYTIEGKGPYSHSSYEYISRDIYDYVMSQRRADEYDDDFDDLSAFNECGEVKTADALYGVEREDTLTEARYSDTNGIIGKAGATYSDADLRKAWDEGKDSDPSMQAYNGDFDAWKKDTVANMSKNEAFDMSYGPDLGKLSWQVASYLDVDALGEDKWIEFICDDPRDVAGDSGTKVMRFEAIGEDAHKYGSIRTAGSRVEVKFRNGSEAMCNSAEEVARFVAGEFGISL